MLIGRSEPRVLLPLAAHYWREPSLAQPKDQFGRQNRTRFVIRGWKADGGLVHERWYDDRDEFDHDLWRHIVEEPYADVAWQWAVTTTLTSPTGSNQTYNVPTDWNNANNFIDTIGGGASGAVIGAASGLRVATGGGGGGWGGYDDLSLTPGGTATYRIAATAAGVTTSGVATIAGNNGNDSWFNGTTYAGASVGALGGLAGAAGTTNQNGGNGQAGKGTANFTGGRGGNVTAATQLRHATGGGGAAGPGGNGGNGTDDAADVSVATSGGTGDNSLGGAGSAGALGVGVNATSSAGTSGTEMGGGIGAGGASGGATADSGHTATSGNGGNYGAASGGAVVVSSQTVTSGTAAQGAIIVTYTPALSGFFLMFMN